MPEALVSRRGRGRVVRHQTAVTEAAKCIVIASEINTVEWLLLEALQEAAETELLLQPICDEVLDRVLKQEVFDYACYRLRKAARSREKELEGAGRSWESRRDEVGIERQPTH